MKSVHFDTVISNNSVHGITFHLMQRMDLVLLMVFATPMEQGRTMVVNTAKSASIALTGKLTLQVKNLLVVQ